MGLKDLVSILLEFPHKEVTTMTCLIDIDTVVMEFNVFKFGLSPSKNLFYLLQ